MISNTFTIRGATVIDGSGSVGVKKDVIIVGGKIAEVGKLIKGNERGKIVDASDLTLTPGFIDMHSHSDLGVLADKAHLSKVTQGVTLEVVGKRVEAVLVYIICFYVKINAFRERVVF